MSDIDVYGIARLLIAEHGKSAVKEVENRIAMYTKADDCTSIKTWYDIEDAIREIQRAPRAEAKKVEAFN
jgi:hypothetical protein